MIEVFEFVTTSHDEYIPRKKAIEAAMPSHNWIKEWHKANAPDAKTSPEISKKKARQLKSPQSQPPEALVDLPESAVKRGMGITEAVFQFLEVRALTLCTTHFY